MLTVPMHRVIAKGTLNDILTEVGLRVGRTKDDLASEL